jgi:hypothetical protein
MGAGGPSCTPRFVVVMEAVGSGTVTPVLGIVADGLSDTTYF